MGLFIGAALGSLGFFLSFMFAQDPLYLFAGQVMWNPSKSFLIVAIPLFILMGELLVRSGLVDRMYQSLNNWLNVVPGGLLHTNIVACSMFAAVSGSSVATAATIGTAALPSFERARYNERFVLGSLAAGGTLGILIPPSLNMIIYGLLTETSIGRLFIAGVFPGLMLAGLFMLFIFLAAKFHPSVAPRETSVPLGVKVRGLIHILPVAFISFIVLGGIYLGFATPTEAAALGVTSALILSILVTVLARYFPNTGFRRSFSLNMLRESGLSAVRTASFAMFIVLGAFVLNFTFTALGVPQQIANNVAGLPLSPLALVGVIIGFYLILGMFMETLSMMVTTMGVIFPIIVGLNLDQVLGIEPGETAIWFGILITILMEAAIITPPVGFNLYVIQGIRRSRGTMIDVIVGTLPFFAMMIVMTGILIAFPQIALWLPRLMKG